MSLPQPAPRPGSADEPESERIYAPSGRHLTGAAANARKQYDAKLRRLDESTAGMRALAQTMLDVLGIDQLRNRVGRERALDLIRFASGEDTAERIAGNWSQEDPGPRQLSTAAPGRDQQGYDGDPLHDPRVTRAIGRVSADEERRIVAEVTAEYKAAAAARERRRRELDGPPSIARGPIGSPAMQPGHITGGNTKGRWDPIGHCLVYGDGQGGDDFWSQHPDHQPGFLQRQGLMSPSLGGGQMTVPPDMGKPVPAAPELPCQHLASRAAGGKFCSSCGDRLAPPDYWGETAPIDQETAPPPPEAPSA